MKNTFRRLLSCLSILSLCILANMGLQVEAFAKTPIANIIQKQQFSKSTQAIDDFILYNNSQSINSNNDKLADHYSHYSHRSHQSHYSSRY
jgi:hypothetical protein